MGNPLQYLCLENPMHRGAWWATVHSVSKESVSTEETTHAVVLSALQILTYLILTTTLGGRYLY